MTMWSEPHFDLPNLEQQLQKWTSELATTLVPLASMASPSVFTAVDVMNTLAADHRALWGIIDGPKFTSCQVASQIQEAAEMTSQ